MLTSLAVKEIQVNRLQLTEKLKDRMIRLGMSRKDLSQLCDVDESLVELLFADTTLEETILEKITRTLGFDLMGDEILSIESLKEKRAEEKALYIVSLVQDTSSLEMQGLENEDIRQLLEETKKQLLDGAYQSMLWKS